MTARDLVHGMAHSLGPGTGGKHTLVGLDADRHGVLAASLLQVYVDAADGKLKFTCSATMTRRFLIWLDFSGPFENAT